MKLIGPLVLLGFLSMVDGEVSADFANCLGPNYPGYIFFKNTPPTMPPDHNNPNRYQHICQKFRSFYRYATLYDTTNRIPVYSAYLYRGRGCNLPYQKPWMIEPQLDGGTDVNMETHKAANLPELLWNQAVDEDYPKNAGLYGLQRGHLYPRGHNTNCDSDQTRSTYTLTNAAPQGGGDNRRWYWDVEFLMANDIDNKCLNKKAYIVTGVVPGNNKMNNRVNIPAYFWSAFCCEDKNNSGNYISRGAYMQMGMGTGATAQWVTIGQLNADLAGVYGQAFGVFGQQIGCS